MSRVFYVLYKFWEGKVMGKSSVLCCYSNTVWNIVGKN